MTGFKMNRPQKRTTSEDRVIAVIGLGYVGLTLAIVLADSGLKVVGLERQKNIVDLLSQGTSHFKEKGMERPLARLINSNKISVTKKLSEISSATAYIITVGTPLDDIGKINLDNIKSATEQVAEIMPENSLVILRSTVKIGTSRNIVKPILDASGKNYQLSVCPERTLEGNAINELRHLPQIIGGFDANASTRAASIFGKITKKTITVSTPETAETIKLVDNTYRDVFFAFSNEVAKLCNGMTGVDANEVINMGSVDYDRTNVAQPGLVGGPCLSKDPHIFSNSAENFGLSLDITKAARTINESMPSDAVSYILKTLNTTKLLEITIAGMAFKGKPETDDLRGSMSLEVLKEFRRQRPSCKIKLFDPLIGKAALESHSEFVFSDFHSSIKGSDAIVICNNHEFFGNLDLKSIVGENTNMKIIYDFWNHFSFLNSKERKELSYVTYGSQWIK
jgi:UDP-N-acetyl-D-mannosaminuronic acid dehydrogenase